MEERKYSESDMLERGQTEDCVSVEYPQHVHVCQPCVERRLQNEATGYCIQCKDFLCKRCSSIHCEPKPSRNHEVLDVNTVHKDQQTLVPGDQCPQHPKRPAIFYCWKHEVFRCTVCITLYHRSCNLVVCVQDEGEKIDTNPEFLDMQNTLTEFQERINKVEHKLETQRFKMESVGKEQRERVNNLHRQLVKLLDKMKENIHKEINKFEEENGVLLKQNCDQINLLKTEAITLKSSIDELKVNNKHAALFRAFVRSRTVISGFETRLHNMMENTLSINYSFVPSTEAEHFLKHVTELGDVKIADSVKFSQLVKDDDNKERDSIGSTKATLVDEINIQLVDDIEPNSITGILMLSDNNLAIVDSNNRSLRVIDCKTKTVRSHNNLPGRPWDVTEVSPTRLAVTMPDMSSVRVIERTTTELSLGYRFDVIGRCHGIAFINGTFIVSCMGDPDFIVLLTQTGEIMKTFTRGQGRPLFSAPLYIRSIPKRAHFVVSNTNGNNVLLMNMDGDVLAVYDSPELVCPRGIAALSDGRLYIKCDERCVIYQLDPSDPTPRPLLIEDCCTYLQSPIAITCDERSMVLYMCSHQCGVVRVFELDA